MDNINQCIIIDNHTSWLHTTDRLLFVSPGSDILDIGTTLDKIVSAVDIEMFENTFRYRSTKGYNLDLTNPFSAFSRSPSKTDFVPVNLTRSNLAAGNSKMDKSQLGERGKNASSMVEVASVNATGMHDGKVHDIRDMNAMKLNNGNDTKMFSLRGNNSNSTTDRSLYNITETNNGNVSDTMLDIVNGTRMVNVSDTNLSNINGTSTSNVNDTNLSNMNETSMGNVNDTNPYSMIDTNTNNPMNDTVLKNSSFNPVINGSQPTQLNDTTNLTIPNTTQIPVGGTEASQLKSPGSTTVTITPTNTTFNPDLDDSQTTTVGNKAAYTATSAIPNAGRGISQDEAALGNPPVLNASGNSGTTSSSGSVVSERATAADDAGYSTAVYQDIAGAKKSDASTTSLVPPENPSSNKDVFLPAVM